MLRLRWEEIGSAIVDKLIWLIASAGFLVTEGSILSKLLAVVGKRLAGLDLSISTPPTLYY
jgi:hypothetical protein